jgi:hypothetical protein
MDWQGKSDSALAASVENARIYCSKKQTPPISAISNLARRSPHRAVYQSKIDQRVRPRYD